MARLLSMFRMSLIVLVSVSLSVPVHSQKTDAEGKPEAANDGVAGDEAKEAEEAAEEDVPEEKEPTPITIGSDAPQLEIEHWIQDGDGHFAKVTEFESGKVYIVEFWATWCGPCISSMPHLAELQREYADRGVQIISITNEDTETVERFLEREVSKSDDSEQPQTFRELTSAYCLTADPDGGSSFDYMRAAKRNGIPCAFIVGKDAKIEWIGHPARIDEPLEAVVIDSWNRDQFREEYIAEQKAEEMLRTASRLLRSGDRKEAVALIDEAIDDSPNGASKRKLQVVKFQMIGMGGAFDEEASKFTKTLLNDEQLDTSSLNRVAWTVYQLHRVGRIKDESLVRESLTASQARVQDAGALTPYLLDTVAHLQEALGDREAAIASQEAAIEAADARMKKRLVGFLKELQKPADDENEDDDSDENEDKDDNEDDDDE